MGFRTLVTSRIPLWATCPRCRQALYFDGPTGLLILPLGLIALFAGQKSDRLALAL